MDALSPAASVCAACPRPRRPPLTPCRRPSAPTAVSFEDAFFRRHDAGIAALERAEQYAAQRGILTEHAEDLLCDLIEEHGQAGRVIVLGDTALLGLCDALDAPRHLYDETLSGSQGFWVLVVPGVIQNRQPRFNEGETLWHLEGVTFALLDPMPPVEP